MIRFFVLCAAVATFAACNDWTEMETVDSKVEKPWEQDPALWAEYTAALRAYKQSEHFIVYARLHNSPEKASSEQDFMRCLPDSLDIVTLTNADNFSKFDAEDMDVMREKGTKVLYQVDYAARAEEFADMQALDAYLDRVVAAVAANGMDGYSFTTDPLATDATARIVEKFAAAKSEGQLLVFEGNPLSLAAADRPKVDFIALDTEKLENVQEVKLQVLNAMGMPVSRRRSCCWRPRSAHPCWMRIARSSRPSMRCRAASSNSARWAVWQLTTFPEITIMRR